jgi:CRP/FNR family transcriptional regulator
MQINDDILIAYGGVAKKINKGEYIFKEDTMPHYFFQILEGEVKVYSSNYEGKEIIQGIFSTGQSFGEPPLLLNKPYPSSAQATKPSIIIRICRENLNHILLDNPELSTAMMFTFAERIYRKATSIQILIGHTPEDKIFSFLSKYKSLSGETGDSHVPYTRQQIANFTGLRVETVIRTLKKMCASKKVKILNHKLYF